jgi:hypothetical protein
VPGWLSMSTSLIILLIVATIVIVAVLDNEN